MAKWNILGIPVTIDFSAPKSPEELITEYNQLDEGLTSQSPDYLPRIERIYEIENALDGDYGLRANKAGEWVERASEDEEPEEEQRGGFFSRLFGK